MPVEPVIISAGVTGLCAIGAATVAGMFSHAAGKRAGRNQFISAVQEAASEVIKNLREEIARLNKRCEEVEGHHKACRSELDQLWATIRKKPVPAYEPKPQPRKRRKSHASDS